MKKKFDIDAFPGDFIRTKPLGIVEVKKKDRYKGQTWYHVKCGERMFYVPKSLVVDVLDEEEVEEYKQKEEERINKLKELEKEKEIKNDPSKLKVKIPLKFKL